MEFSGIIMNKQILAVAAHPDDEVLGCGGTIARHVEEGDKVHVIFMADGVSARGEEHLASNVLEERNQSALKACQILGAETPYFLGLPDNQMDSLTLLDIIQPLEKKLETIKPEVVYTHHHSDLNIDHQLTHRAVMTACRPVPDQCVKQILAFEVVSSTEWALGSEAVFTPNYFVTLSSWQVESKLLALQAYQQELREYPHARSIKSVESLLQARGASVGQKYCEGFQLIRAIL